MSHSLLMTLSDCWQRAPVKREVELTVQADTHPAPTQLDVCACVPHANGSEPHPR